MWPSRLLVAAAVGSLFASPPLAAAPKMLAGRHVLQVAWHDPTRCARTLEPLALRELIRLARRMGLELRPRIGECGVPAAKEEILIVLVDREHGSGGRHMLGCGKRAPGQQPAIWVHMPGVRAVLGIDARRALPHLRVYERRALGLAIGRVAAHELVHVLAPGVRHGSGLMSNELSLPSLVASSIEVDADVVRAVREADPRHPAYEASRLVGQATEGASRAPE